MAREINLVPDIKGEVIKALKIRNIIFFTCIVVAIASVVVTAVFGSIAGGQQIAIDSKQKTIDNLSAKLNSYSDLSDFLTIKDQLGDLADLTNNKHVISRTFKALSAFLPTGADTIKVSELNIDLSDEEPTLAMEAQADAGKEPYIDYNVLESFKKSMEFMRYDYGEYVDKDGNSIPAYCMVETGDDGATFKDADKGIYAFWSITGDGCNTLDVNNNDGDEDEDESTKVEIEAQFIGEGYTLEEYEGEKVVRIWRTPQFGDWYGNGSNDANMTLDGEISGVSHFKSNCVTYTGYKTSEYSRDANETIELAGTEYTWVSRNDSCLLVPGALEGIEIEDSSNGRDSSDRLVLRFSATITLAPEFYEFNNHHMMAVAPSGRRNVTDSYVQIQEMFKERAVDCAPDDVDCNSSSNLNGGSSNSSSSSSSSTIDASGLDGFNSQSDNSTTGGEK